jgi:hypothetical protein
MNINKNLRHLIGQTWSLKIGERFTKKTLPRSFAIATGTCPYKGQQSSMLGVAGEKFLLVNFSKHR